jgi:hypothetical protein
MIEYSGRAEYYNPEELKDFPAKMRNISKVQKFVYANALRGIMKEEFDQAMNTMCNTDQGKKIALGIERCIWKFKEVADKNYFTMDQIKEMDIKKHGKKSMFWNS